MCFASPEDKHGAQMADTSWPVAFPCPQCLEKSGRAFKLASVTAGRILVSVRCRECAHEWVIERDTPTFAIRRQPDRRRYARVTGAAALAAVNNN